VELSYRLSPGQKLEMIDANNMERVSTLVIPSNIEENLYLNFYYGFGFGKSSETCEGTFGLSFLKIKPKGQIFTFTEVFKDHLNSIDSKITLTLHLGKCYKYSKQRREDLDTEFVIPIGGLREEERNIAFIWTLIILVLTLICFTCCCTCRKVRNKQPGMIAIIYPFFIGVSYLKIFIYI
jgi:hypothetical protein